MNNPKSRTESQAKMRRMVRSDQLRIVRDDNAWVMRQLGGVQKPKTWGDCEAEEGTWEDDSCPWVACKHHLYLDVNEETGTIKFNFPDKEPWELQHTCALRLARRGGMTLEEVGEVQNVTRERIRQMESIMSRKLIHTKAARELQELAEDVETSRNRRQTIWPVT